MQYVHLITDVVLLVVAVCVFGSMYSFIGNAALLAAMQICKRKWPVAMRNEEGPFAIQKATEIMTMALYWPLLALPFIVNYLFGKPEDAGGDPRGVGD